MKSTPFQTKHALEFGQEVVSKDAKGDVTVLCLFCIHEGRDNVEVSGSPPQAKGDLNHQIFHEAIDSFQLSLPFEVARRVLGRLPGAV
jgi:hypothetical protein